MELTDFNMGFFSLAGKKRRCHGRQQRTGTGVVRCLAKGGANVMAASIMDDDGTTRQWVEECGTAYHYLYADITSKGQCRRIVEECAAVFGSIDILVNCAGICINVEDVTRFTRKEWDHMVAVNLTAAFEMTHEACKPMIRQMRGRSSTSPPCIRFWAGSGLRLMPPPSTVLSD